MADVNRTGGWVEAADEVEHLGLGDSGEVLHIARTEKKTGDETEKTESIPSDELEVAAQTEKIAGDRNSITRHLGLAAAELGVDRRGDFVGWFLLRQQHARKLPPAQGALAMCHLAEASHETPGQAARSAGCYREARTLDGNCTPAIKALQAIGQMKQGRVVELSEEIALSAATISLKHRLPMADSFIYATAQLAGAVVWTQDVDFKNLADVNYKEARTRAS